MSCEVKSVLEDPVLAAEVMHSLGYRQVSRRFQRVARVDLSAKKFLVWMKKEFGRVDRPQAYEDFYRRCVSKDVIVGVPEEIMHCLRSEGG